VAFVIGRALAWQVALAFGIALPAGALLVAALQALRLSPVAAAAGAGASEWAFALGAAALLGVEPVAPAAFAIAAVLVVLRWEAGGELLAARAAGLSPGRLAGATLVVALAASLLLAFVSTILAPAAVRHLEGTWQALLPRAIAGTVRPGAMVEVLPGLQVYAARRGPEGTLEDVVVAQGDAVLAARSARVRVLAGESGPALVVEAERGALRRGALEARFSRLVLPVELGAEVALRRGAIGGPAVAGGSRLAAASFCLVAIASLLAALLCAARPATLALLVAGLVAARELALRVGAAEQEGLGPGLAAALPVLVLAVPLGILSILAARRDSF
jgi:hypothetical protein